MSECRDALIALANKLIREAGGTTNPTIRYCSLCNGNQRVYTRLVDLEGRMWEEQEVCSSCNRVTYSKYKPQK